MCPMAFCYCKILTFFYFIYRGYVHTFIIFIIIKAKLILSYLIIYKITAKSQEKSGRGYSNEYQFCLMTKKELMVYGCRTSIFDE